MGWRLQAGDKFRQMHALRDFFCFLFFVSRDRALVKPAGRFRQMIRQNAWFGPRMCLLGFRKIKKKSSSHPQNRKKPEFCGSFKAFPMENKEMLTTFEP